jgi:hypothetical protein
MNLSKMCENINHSFKCETDDSVTTWGFQFKS